MMISLPKSNDTAKQDKPMNCGKTPEIDLPPKHWRSDRQKQREPLLGYGAGALLAETMVSVVTIGLMAVVLLLTGFVKEQAYNLLYEGPQSSRDLTSCNATKIDGYKSKGLD